MNTMNTAPLVRRFSHAMLAAIVMIGLSACTDRPETEPLDDDTTAVPTDTLMGEMGEMGVIGSDTVEVTLVDFDINMPTSLPAGPTIFKITNEGTVEHNFEVEGQGIEEELSTNLQPGASQTMEIDVQEGTYVVYCPVEDHRSRGMEVSLTVTPSTAAPAPGGPY